MREYKLTLEGIDCPNCANRVETALNNSSYVDNAGFDFNTNTLSLKSDNLTQVEDIIRKIEPHASIVEIYDENGKQLKIKNQDSLGRGLSYEMGIIGVFVALFALAESILHLSFFDHLLGDMRLIFAFAILFPLYGVAGIPIFRASVRNIKNKIFFDENTLMLFATLAALCLGEVSEAVAVLLFFRVGELLESRAVQKSKDSIRTLLTIMPDIAHKKQGNSVIDLKPEELQVGDEIIVKLGEKVPVDALVLAGRSYFDMRSINGESVPVSIKEGESVLAGAINTGSPLTLRVLKVFRDTHVAKIAQLLKEASAKKARTDKLITHFAKIYTPIVFVCALCVAILPPLFDSQWGEWLYRALVVMMISCPCALVIAVPLGYFAAIGRASTFGVLFKGSIHLESLAQVRHIAFDKTGTLTQGSFEILEIISNQVQEHEILSLAYALESHSNHPIAQAICKYIPSKFVAYEIDEVEEIGGMGLRAKLKNNVDKKWSKAFENALRANGGSGELLLGNAAMMQTRGIEPLKQKAKYQGIYVYIALNGVCIGQIVIGDRLKEQAQEVLINLRKLGVTECAILSGDTQENVDIFAHQLGVTQAFGGLLPEQKARKMQELKAVWQGKSAFVGDGINDSVVLRSSDVGISINTGEQGNDISKESADIILTSPNLKSLEYAIRLAQYTRKITWQNISFALLSKLVLIVLGVMGLANMWLAVFGDVGVALLALLNAMRIGRGEEKFKSKEKVC